MALMQMLRTAVGYKKQADLVTPVPAASMWSLRQTSRNVPMPVLTTENDRDDLGKGIWTTAVYPTSWDAAFPWEAYLTSENAAEIVGFALGKVGATAPAGTGTSYTFVPFDEQVDCQTDMPTTTFVSQIKSCDQPVVDTALLGVACEDFTIRLNSGIGRDNAVIASNWVGTGNFLDPSGIVIPPFYNEHLLNAGMATIITVNNVNYITNKRFVSCEFGYKNNIKLDQGYFPGSGSKNNAAIRNRMRRGVPDVTLNFVAEFEHDSVELDYFLGLTEGNAEVKLVGPLIAAGPDAHMVHAKFPRVMFRSAVIAENDNTLTVNVECQVLQDSGTGKVLEITVVTEQPGILTAAEVTEEQLKAA